jgi:hypothetical protein
MENEPISSSENRRLFLAHHEDLAGTIAAYLNFAGVSAMESRFLGSKTFTTQLPDDIVVMTQNKPNLRSHNSSPIVTDPPPASKRMALHADLR